MLIYKEFSFDAAHYLSKVPPGHKCAVMHGHTYHLKIWLKGNVNEQGWVMDFAVVKAAVKHVIDLIDHQCLNTIEGLENPTSEVLVQWLWHKLKPSLPLLHEIELRETPTSGVVYNGE